MRVGVWGCVVLMRRRPPRSTLFPCGAVFRSICMKLNLQGTAVIESNHARHYQYSDILQAVTKLRFTASHINQKIICNKVYFCCHHKNHAPVIYAFIIPHFLLSFKNFLFLFFGKFPTINLADFIAKTTCKPCNVGSCCCSVI